MRFVIDILVWGRGEQMEKRELERIVDTYFDMVLRIAYQNTKNYADAEDICQEVMIKVMKQSLFEDEKYLRAWLIRVTINHCHDYHRSFWRKKRKYIDETNIAAPIESQFVFDELWKLPVFDRNILYLYYFEGYTIKEIGFLLNKKQNTINSRLTRARKKLKMIMEDSENG